MIGIIVRFHPQLSTWEQRKTFPWKIYDMEKSQSKQSKFSCEWVHLGKKQTNTYIYIPWVELRKAIKKMQIVYLQQCKSKHELNKRFRFQLKLRTLSNIQEPWRKLEMQFFNNAQPLLPHLPVFDPTTVRKYDTKIPKNKK